MDDLRRDVKEVFEKGQANLGDLAGARERMMHGALAARASERGSRMQLAASVAAILIAAVVIATFVYVRAGNQPTHGGPIPTPTPSASPTPLSNRLDVPADTPVILYHDPANFDQIDGMTWGGDKSGVVGQGGLNGGSANPAGTFYGTSSDVRDRTGQVVVALDAGVVKGFNGFWADDEFEFCEMIRSAGRDVTAPGILQVSAPGQRAKSIARLGTFASANLNGGGPAVVACSPGNDRAVVYQSGGQGVGVTKFWVVQLSTGHVVWSGGSGSGIAASRDGDYVALGQTSQAAHTTTTLYGPGGAVEAHIDAQVYSFSWDAALLVMQKQNAPVTVVRWRDGSVVWTAAGPGSYFVSQASAEPGGPRLAVGIITDFSTGNGFPLVDLFVIDPDGKVVFARKDIALM